MGFRFPRGLGAPLNHPKKDGPFGIAFLIRTFLDSEYLKAAALEWAWRGRSKRRCPTIIGHPPVMEVPIHPRTTEQVEELRAWVRVIIR